MASTAFTDNVTVIYSAWLNDINNAVYNGVFPNGQVHANADTATLATLSTNCTNSLGYNQTWQNFTGSRAINTVYTNSGTAPIALNIQASSPAGPSILQITTTGGIVIYGNEVSGTALCYPQIFAIIPAGATYQLGINTGTPTILSWLELR